jgi:hypothetical protein
MYCGCRTCCGKLTWCFTILFLLLAVIGLAVGLYFSVPCIRCVKAFSTRRLYDQSVMRTASAHVLPAQHLGGA